MIHAKDRDDQPVGRTFTRGGLSERRPGTRNRSCTQAILLQGGCDCLIDISDQLFDRTLVHGRAEPLVDRASDSVDQLFVSHDPFSISNCRMPIGNVEPSLTFALGLIEVKYASGTFC